MRMRELMLAHFRAIPRTLAVESGSAKLYSAAGGCQTAAHSSPVMHIFAPRTFTVAFVQ